MSTTIDAKARERVGSRDARKLRAAGRIPASICGEGRPNADVHLDLAQFQAARRAHQNLFEMNLGSEVEHAIVREVQWDSMGDHPVHVDFRRVVLGKPIEAEVELVFKGQPRGGALQPLHDSIEIRAIPSKIPSEIEVAVEVMHVDERPALSAGDLVLPEGVELVSSPELPVCQVVTATVVAEPTEGEEAEEGPTEPELVTPPKKEEEAGE